MFAAIYAWKAIEGREERFRAGWRRVTEAFLAEHGSLGSRLHRSADGRWVRLRPGLVTGLLELFVAAEAR